MKLATLSCLTSDIKPGRALLLEHGEDADISARLNQHLQERGFEVIRQSCATIEELEAFTATTSPGTFDAVFLPALMCRLEYDRWALQLIHRLLKNGGTVSAIVSNKLHPIRLVGEILSRVRKPPSKKCRSYFLPRFLSRLESLGYSIKSVQANTVFQKIADTLVLIAEKKPSIFGNEGRPFPGFRAFRDSFESANKLYLDTREEWLTRHPHFKSGSVEPLNAHAYKNKSVLILAPHPDDEIIGCGGAALELLESGAKVSVLYATDGSISAALNGMPEEIRHSIRLRHAETVSQAAGFGPNHYWKDPGPTLQARPEHIESLRNILTSLQPALIFVPFILDSHPDHVMLNKILAEALEETKLTEETRVASYEIWGLLPANSYCDITARMPEKESLLFKYTTEMRVDDYVHRCEALHFYNSRMLTGKDGFVEAFLTVNLQEYLSFF